MPTIHDDRTPNLGLPLPHQDNELLDDVGRIREAVTGLDAHAQAVSLGVGALQDASAKVRVSAGDAAPGPLEAKITAGTNITLTKVNAGGNEQYRIDSQPGSTISQSAPTYVVSGQTAALTGRSIVAAYEQIAGQAFNLTYNTRADYVEQDPVNGTDSTAGTFVLHNTAGATIDSYTKLLIHADGSNGDTTIVDERGITPFGTHCAYFDGSSRFTVPVSYKVAFVGQTNFTAECWFRHAIATANNNVRVFVIGTGTEAAGIIYNTSSQKFGLLWNNSGPTLTTGTYAQETWYHIALVRAGTAVTVYIDGAPAISITDASSPLSTAYPITIGDSYGGGGNAVNGWIDEFRVSNTARYTAGFTRPTTAFTRDASTVYLFHFDDGHGSQLIRDDSRSGHDVYLSSTITISGSRAKFGTTSASLLGSQGISIGGQKRHQDFELGAHDFTVDFWIHPLSVAATQFLQLGDYAYDPLLDLTGGTLTVYLSTTGSSWNIANGTTVGTMVVNQWQHVAITRSGTNLHLFLDGVLKQTFAVGTGVLSATNNYFHIGSNRNNGYGLFGNIDEFRFKKGVAEWTATFAPPTAPYVTDDRTVVLLHFEGANGDKVTLDSSESSYGNDAFGDTAIPVLAFQGTTALSSAQTRGGNSTSLALNGSSQYAQIIYAQPGAGHPLYFANWTQFCVEAWFHHGGSPSGVLMQMQDGSGIGNWIQAMLTSASNLRTYVSHTAAPAYFTIDATVSSGWHHYALVRDGRGWGVYIDGTLAGSIVNPDKNIYYPAATMALTLGSDRIGGAYFTGAIDSVRITHGKPRYQANFTPGNITADGDTALCWVFNGSVGQRWVKELSKNTALISATNARTVKDGRFITPNISSTLLLNTSQQKFGTASLAGNGTAGNYYTLPHQSDWCPSGDFTVEAWLRPSASAASGGSAIQKQGASNYTWALYHGTGTKVQFEYHNGTGYVSVVSSSSLSTSGGWTHVAVVRSGSNLYLFVDGVLEATNSGASAAMRQDASGTLYIGTNSAGGPAYWGYLDELRISNTARWTANFSVPTIAYGQQYVTGPYTVTTSNTSHLDVSAFTSIDSVAVGEVLPPGTSIKYLASFDGRASWLGKNLIPAPEAFGNATWGPGNATVSENVTTDPFGGSTADKLTENTANTTHRVAVGSIAASGAHTASVYVKAAGRNYASLELWNGSVAVYCNADLTNGTVASGSHASALVTAAGNGWYRLSVALSLTGAINSVAVYAMNASGTVAAYTGDGSSGIYVFGALLNRGAVPANYTTGGFYAATLADIETYGMTSTEFKTALLAWSPALGTTIDVAASLKAANPAFTPALDNVTVTMDEYVKLNDVDYTVKRKKANGVQTLVFTRVKAGNANHVFDFVS